MSLLNLFAALSFAVLGIAIVFLLVASILRAIGLRIPSMSLLRLGNHRRAQRLELLLSSADSKRLSSLSAVFLIFQQPRSKSAADTMATHNLKMLDRLIEIAELRSIRLHPGLERVEALITARTELAGNFVGLLAARSRIEKRRRDEGKGLPEWSRSDFEQRIKEVKEQLALNSKELERSLATILERFRDSNPPEPITIQ